jgi:hypothetical protein
MTKSCALLNFDRLYVTSYDAIWKMDGKQIQVSVLLLSIFFLWNFTHVSKNRVHNTEQNFLMFKYIINIIWYGSFRITSCINPRPISSLQLKLSGWYWCLGLIRDVIRKEPYNILYISSSDNKSVSHWIMFDYFFLFSYVPHLFLLTCVKFHGKKIDNNYILTHICLHTLFPNGVVWRHIKSVKVQ